MVSIVDSVLQKARDDEEKANEFVQVEKQVDLVYDLRHMAGFDQDPLDHDEISANKEEYFHHLARDNTQLVVNKIFTDLQTTKVDDIVVAKLPKLATYILPRAQHCPKKKEPTKWEKFAKEKGIQNKKKEKLVWDEVSKDWKPRFGYRGINQKHEENWVVEIPHQKDPMVDYIEMRKNEKSERVAKNELQRLRNIARSAKLKVAGTSGIVPNADLSKDQMEKAKFLAKEATASLGKFTEKLRDEKEPHNIGRKRKFESNSEKDLSGEQSNNLSLADNILKKMKKSINDQDEDSVLRTANKRKTAVKRAQKDDRDEDIGDRFDKRNRVDSRRGGRGGGRGGRGGSRGGRGGGRGGSSRGGGRGGGRGGRGRK